MSSRLSVEDVRSAISERNYCPRIDHQKQMEVFVFQIEGLDQKPGAHTRQVCFHDVENKVREPISYVVNTADSLEVKKA